MMLQHKIIVFISVLFCMGIVHAENTLLNRIYYAAWPVSSQSEVARLVAVKQGLVHVLIKLTGNMQIDTLPAIKLRLEHAIDYLQEYHYLPYASTTTPYLLVMHFDQQNINHLLLSADIPFLGQNRPLILAWVAVPDHSRLLNNSNHSSKDMHLEILSSELDNDYVMLIKRQAREYGLSIIFPLVDISDMNQVSVADVYSFSDFLRTVSKRYQPDALLIGHVLLEQDHFRSEWQFILGKARWHWVINDLNMENSLSVLMQNVHHALMEDVKQATQSQQEKQWLTLIVSNVHERDDLLKLMHYLKRLAVVSHIQLIEVDQDTVKLAVLIHGPVEIFKRHIIIGRHFALQATAESMEMMPAVLPYQFIP